MSRETLNNILAVSMAFNWIALTVLAVSCAVLIIRSRRP